MKKILKNKQKRRNLLAFALVTVAFIILQSMNMMGLLSSKLRGFLIPTCAYIVMAVSLNLLVGVCGELSLGHAGFMSIGAFSGIIIASLIQDVVVNSTLRLLVAMVVGGALAGFVGFLVGIPVLRLRGDYLAIVTLAFGEILKNVIQNLYAFVDVNGFHLSLSTSAPALGEGAREIISGPMGAISVQKIATFPVGFGLILFTLFVVTNLIDSKEGRAIMAIRDNRIAAESVGINVTAFRMKAFVLSAVLAGMAGVLFGLNYSSITSAKFNFNTSINILVFVVLGGMGNILGSVISATVLYILPEAMRALDDYRMLLYAVVLIVVMLFTWSPKVKDSISAVTDRITKRFTKGVATHE